MASLVYQAIMTRNNLELEKGGPPKTVAEEAIMKEQTMLASMVGFFIYIAVIVCIFMTIVRTKII